MPRGVKKPCEICEQDFVMEKKEGCGKHLLQAEFYPNNQLFSIFSYAVDSAEELEELTIDMEFRYFPFCGRKLDVY